ncbi:MAG: DUF222 domain-containing protein [Frankiaceae bacterium]
MPRREQSRRPSCSVDEGCHEPRQVRADVAGLLPRPALSVGWTRLPEVGPHDGPAPPRRPGRASPRRPGLRAAARHRRGQAARLAVTIDLAALAVGDRVDLPWSGALDGEALRRLGCDAELLRVVLGPAGEVLDLGRAARLPTTAQRRALAARDGGCLFPGCDRAPPWCQAHHLVHWVDGGPTDLASLASRKDVPWQ